MKKVKSLFRAPRFWRANYLILRELKYFPKIIILALAFTIFSAILQGIGIGFVMTFLQSLTEPSSPPVKLGIDWIDIHILGINLSEIERIYRISGFLIFTTILQAIFTGLSTAYGGIAQSQLVLQIQKRIFDQLQSLNLSYFTKTRSGDLVNGITAEISELKNVFEIIAFIIVRSFILLVYVASVFLISWQLTFIVVIIFSLMSVSISKVFAMIREASFEITKARSQYTSRAIEFISGIRTIQAAGAQSFEGDKIHQSAFQTFEAEKKTWITRAIVEPIPEAVITLVALGVLMFAFTALIPKGELQIASLLTFLFIIIRTLPIVRQLNNARGRLSRYQGAVRATNELLNPKDKSFFENGNQEFHQLEQGLVFDSVNFAYASGVPVLKNINLTIKSGEMVALVGASGAGKSTIADLLPRFYDPVGGHIFVDGVDLCDIEIQSFRQNMAVVSQDTFIFNSSVRENIAYSLFNVEDEEIIEAARMANAFEFIQALPDGLDTQLGDRGVLLSGGQRQRIAIARALLRNPQILILDEATSALDSVTERLIQESIEKLTVGRTVIAIAHRLSTIARADQVIVLEKGEIVEKGKYNELLEKKGQLWNYHNMQR